MEVKRGKDLRWVRLTGAAQALLPQAQQHALANVTVDGLVEMFHPPKVLAIRLDHLFGRGATKNGAVSEAAGRSVETQLCQSQRSRFASAGGATWLRGGAASTSALHAGGLGFEPQWSHQASFAI